MKDNWTICLECKGLGKKSRRLRKKVKLRYQRELAEFEKNNDQGTPPVRPVPHLENCLHCKGSGLVAASQAVFHQDTDKKPSTEPVKEPTLQAYPHVAIIGAGIGGVALAVACMHRGIPFTLYERDIGFSTRSQGYGLTLQQASRAIEGLGVFSLKEGVTSIRHVVHTPDGKIIADWGIKDLQPQALKSPPKRTNVHIARQALRQELLEQLGGHQKVQWGHQLVSLVKKEGQEVDLAFHVKSDKNPNGYIKHAKADLVVGADGIRSSVRRLIIGEQASPLRYLDCMVILGICPLEAIKGLKVNSAPKDEQHNHAQDSFLHPLLDSATVFQTANGHDRIYMMPFTADSVMWQLSFPMAENEARALSEKGPHALKKEAMRRCQWHDPIPQILMATQFEQVSGYPVYDRAQLEPELLSKSAMGDKVTLIGDAAHPMSPFKGQGANQALLDAISLARTITKGCRPLADWRKEGIRESVLTEFEAEMLERSAAKVKGSAEAAQFLHSDVVLHEGNEPRGRVLLRKGEGEQE